MHIIEANKLVKIYDDNLYALNDIELSIHKGECFGVLGPNGAGKSTLINILSTQLSHSHGHLSILGLDPKTSCKEIRPFINIVNGGESGHYPWLNALETVEYFCHLYKIKHPDLIGYVKSLLEMVKLEPSAWSRKVGTYSKGMKQRLHIARGLVNKPQILYLDEPTIGLDIESVQGIRSLIRRLVDEGTTIILTSHIMSDIEHCCDRVTIIERGIQRNTLDIASLKLKSKTIVRCRIGTNQTEIYECFNDNFDLIGFKNFGNEAKFSMALLPEQLPLFHQLIVDNNASLLKFEVEPESLEQVYLNELSQE